MLDYDLNNPPRSPGDLAALAAAVITAAPGDETHFLEWKSTLDLTAAAGQYAIARTIIGMFNRPVALARSVFDGVGYLFVGVESGAAAGTTIPDSAVVTSGISKYLAGPKIAWYHLTVTVQGHEVLVVIVESPKPGDRIASLAKTFQPSKGKGADAGTIFVRATGLTVPATPSDIQSLEDRLLDHHRAPIFEAVGGVRVPPEGFFIIDDDAESLDEWVDQQHNQLLLSEQVRSHPNLHLDARTPEQFRTEVDGYARDLRERAPAWARAIAYSLYNEENAWALTIENTSDEALRDVELTLTLPPGVEVYAIRPEHKVVERPKAYNTQMPPSILDSVYGGRPFIPDMTALFRTSLDIEAVAGGWTVTASWKLVQAHKVETSESFVLIGMQSGLSVPPSFSASMIARAGNRRGTIRAVAEIASTEVHTASIQRLIEARR